jgi:uncharacterized protein YcfJ
MSRFPATPFAAACVAAVLLVAGPALAQPGASDTDRPLGPPQLLRTADGHEGANVDDRNDFRRRRGERLFQARVLDARAVMGTPERRCWIERGQVTQEQRRSGANVPGAVAGAVIGGILGHQIGGGFGKDLATAGGVVAGAAVGAQVGRDDEMVTRRAPDVQRCTQGPPNARPDYWDVTYRFRGRQHRLQMSGEPGATILVNRQGEPRG